MYIAAEQGGAASSMYCGGGSCECTRKNGLVLAALFAVVVGGELRALLFLGEMFCVSRTGAVRNICKDSLCYQLWCW